MADDPVATAETECGYCEGHGYTHKTVLGHPGIAVECSECIVTDSTPATAALTADPQWSDARVVGHVRLPTYEMRWVVEQADGTQHRVVAVVVQDDWETPYVPPE